MYRGNQRCGLEGYVTHQITRFFDVNQTEHGSEVLKGLYQRFLSPLRSISSLKEEKTSRIQGNAPGLQSENQILRAKKKRQHCSVLQWSFFALGEFFLNCG